MSINEYYSSKTQCAIKIIDTILHLIIQDAACSVKVLYVCVYESLSYLNKLNQESLDLQTCTRDIRTPREILGICGLYKYLRRIDVIGLSHISFFFSSNF